MLCQKNKVQHIEKKRDFFKNIERVLTIHYGNILRIYLVYFIIYLKYTKNDLPKLEFHAYAWGWESNLHIILDVVDMWKPTYWVCVDML